MIYLDMDGVFADFARGAHELVGPDWELELDQPKWGALAQLPRLYANLPVCSDAKSMFQRIWLAHGESAPSQVQILTALSFRAHSSFPLAAQDKVEWARRHLHPDIRVHFGPYAVDKQLHVRHSTDVLIDDMGLNISQWNAAGGIGILHTSTENSLRELSARLGIEF